MRPDADPLALTPDERIDQIARLLAMAVLRLRPFPAPPAPSAPPAAEKTPKSPEISLELSPQTRLSGPSS